MPELPEVEVVKRSLEMNISNLIIKKVIINNNKLRYKINKKKFKKIINKKIISIERRSKYLLIKTSKKIVIIVHLGMTGKFFIIDKEKRKKTSFYYKLSKKDEKHNHIIFYLSNNIKLIYNDVRRFGFIKIAESTEIHKNEHLRSLGPEPLSKNFNYNYFKKNIIKKNKNLKNLLMDQKFVSGLGNIYVNEILHLSKLKPTKKTSNLSIDNIISIVRFTKEVLAISIKKGGSSINNFNDVRGNAGVFQQSFRVYGREGKKCRKNLCKGVIKKTIISNRSTFFCQTCQK
jgi:formamidopyrimidine-DNA glycosylase